MANMTLQVFNVSIPKTKDDSLLDFAIDSPKIGNQLQDQCRITGWVLGKISPAVAIEAVSDDGTVLEKIPLHQTRPGVAKKYPNITGSDKSGFDKVLNISDLKSNQKFSLRAIFKNGESTKLGTIDLQPQEKTIVEQSDRYSVRMAIANQYIKGDGIEIGALHSPLQIPELAHVKYVDRMSVKGLREQYPDLKNKNLVEVDIIDNGESLENIPNSSQDFVIANHFLEHCQNPIYAIENMLRVLKPKGILYLAIPDKRFTFDRDRPTTTIEHLLKDYQDGPAWSKRPHFEEWVKYVSKVKDPVKAQSSVNHLIDIDYSIHFHVWTQTQILELLFTLQSKLNFPFDVNLVNQNHNEIITVMAKSGGQS